MQLNNFKEKYLSLYKPSDLTPGYELIDLFESTGDQSKVVKTMVAVAVKSLIASAQLQGLSPTEHIQESFLAMSDVYLGEDSPIESKEERESYAKAQACIAAFLFNENEILSDMVKECTLDDCFAILALTEAMVDDIMFDADPEEVMNFYAKTIDSIV